MVVAIVGAVIWLVVSSGRTARAKREQEAAEKTRMSRAISALAQKHDAVQDWEDALPDGFDQRTYTAHLQDLLVRDGGRPALFLAPLQDVVREGDGYTLHFYDAFRSVRLRPTEIKLVLRATRGQAEKILEQRSDGMFEMFAVIAHVESVRKAAITLNPYGVDDEYGESLIDAEDVFFITGECLDFIFVGDYEYQE